MATRWRGAELAKRVTVTRPDTKVLCMSGYTDDAVVRHGILEADVAFLQKPFTPNALAQKAMRDGDPGAAARRPDEPVACHVAS